jgi:hypothetical protein
MRVETLAKLLVDSSITNLRLHFRVTFETRPLMCASLAVPVPGWQRDDVCLAAACHVDMFLLHAHMTHSVSPIQEMVLLDFVATAWPVVVYVLLEGKLLLDTLERNHAGVFDVAKVDGGVTLSRRRRQQQAQL